MLPPHIDIPSTSSSVPHSFNLYDLTTDDHTGLTNHPGVYIFIEIENQEKGGYEIISFNACDDIHKAVANEKEYAMNNQANRVGILICDNKEEQKVLADVLLYFRGSSM